MRYGHFLYFTDNIRPGPATQLAQRYASLFHKTLRKGLYFDVCMSLIFVSTLEKKAIFIRHFHWKRVIFWCFKSAFFNKRGPFFPRKNQFFLNLENDHTSSPFTCEWPDRDIRLATCFMVCRKIITTAKQPLGKNLVDPSNLLTSICTQEGVSYV